MEAAATECPVGFINPQSWADILKLSSDFPDEFFQLPMEIGKAPEIWQNWYDLDAPEAHNFPFDYKQKIRPFQKLMFLRCFRVDRVYRAIGDYITEIMGEEYIMPPVISLDHIYEQSSPSTPVVFILSPGSDPTAELMKLADRYYKIYRIMKIQIFTLIVKHSTI